jgi:hypothetical protein
MRTYVERCICTNITLAINHQSLFDLVSSSSSNNWPSPPPTINISVDTEIKQNQPPLLCNSIRGDGLESIPSATSPLPGSETLSSGNYAKPDTKPNNKSREKGAVKDCVAVLQLMLSETIVYNASKSSVQWRNLHHEMLKSYYLHCGSALRSSLILYGHTVKMDGSFKTAMRNLALLPGVPKFSKSHLSAADKEISKYINSLKSLLISDKERYMPKFTAGEQPIDGLERKSVSFHGMLDCSKT